ncbi:MAG: hypothetical protein IJD88_01650 [Clostridia bacterium]|nr:hypothetical protein [Clostridia bacterium]
MIITSVYALSSELFTITTVIGEETTEETYRYNSPVTLTIEDSQIPANQVFVGWSLNGTDVASYDRTYKFYAYKSMTVTAVFADTLEEVKAIVTLTTEIKEATETTYKAEFMVTREIPEDFVFISSGLLLTQSAEVGTNENLTFEAHSEENQTAIRLYRTVHTDNDGQYMLTVKTSSGKTFYARGFIVYINGDGEVITDYTDVVSVTDK